MEIFASDISVLEGPAYAISDQILSVMLGLGCGVNCAEASTESLVDQIG